MRKLIGFLLAVGAAVIIFIALSEITSPSGAVVQSQMQDIENKVAKDAVEQYGIAERSGTQMDKCVQAGMVTASYLQAKDEINYSKWKAVQRVECRRAGLPE